MVRHTELHIRNWMIDWFIYCVFDLFIDWLIVWLITLLFFRTPCIGEKVHWTMDSKQGVHFFKTPNRTTSAIEYDICFNRSDGDFVFNFVIWLNFFPVKNAGNVKKFLTMTISEDEFTRHCLQTAVGQVRTRYIWSMVYVPLDRYGIDIYEVWYMCLCQVWTWYIWSMVYVPLDRYGLDIYEVWYMCRWTGTDWIYMKYVPVSGAN